MYKKRITKGDDTQCVIKGMGPRSHQGCKNLLSHDKYVIKKYCRFYNINSCMYSNDVVVDIDSI